MKKMFLIWTLPLLALTQSVALAQDVKAMSTFELTVEMNVLFGKMGLACTASAVPVVVLGVVDTVPLVSLASYGSCDVYNDGHGCNDITKRAEGREMVAQYLGGAGSLAVDILGGATDLVIAPFDYLAHGKLEFSYKAFPTVREAYRPTQQLAKGMYADSSICLTTKKRADVVAGELKARALNREALPASPQVADNSQGQPKLVAKVDGSSAAEVGGSATEVR